MRRLMSTVPIHVVLKPRDIVTHDCGVGGDSARALARLPAELQGSLWPNGPRLTICRRRWRRECIPTTDRPSAVSPSSHTTHSTLTMATQRLSNVLSHITPGKSPLEQMYAPPQTPPHFFPQINIMSLRMENVRLWLTACLQQHLPESRRCCHHSRD